MPDSTEVRLAMSPTQMIRIAIGLIFGRTAYVPDLIKDGNAVEMVAMKLSALDPLSTVPADRCIAIRRNEFGFVTGFSCGTLNYEGLRILTPVEVDRLSEVTGLGFRFHPSDKVKLSFDTRRIDEGCSLVLTTFRSDPRIGVLDMVPANSMHC